MKKLLLFLITFPIVYSFAQIENGMVAHFPFNGNIDDISNSNIIATNNGASFTNDRNGVSNYALACNDVGFISFNNGILKQPLPVSVSYWVYFNSISEVNNLFKTDNVFDDFHGIWMNNLPTGGITLSFGGGSGVANSSNQRYFTSNTGVFTSGVWYHVVGIIRDYNDMEIYIDCNQIAGTYGGTGATSPAYSAGGDSRIGCTIGSAISPADQIFDGALDQFVFWDRALTPSEITFLCDTENPLYAPTFKLDEKELVKIVDLMGRETEFKPNTPLIYIYSDGSTEKVFSFE